MSKSHPRSKKQLEKIGIKISIVKVNFNIYNSYIKNKNYDMILAGSIVSNNPNIELKKKTSYLVKSKLFQVEKLETMV